MANPIISRTELTLSSSPMTIQGVVRKTGFLLGMTTLSALGFFFYGAMTGLTSGFVNILAFVSLIVAMGLGLTIAFKPHLAKKLAVPYALTEGIFVGAISLVVTRFFPSVALTALTATFVTAAVMLALYRSRVIRVTEKFRSIIMSAVIAIALVYMVQIALKLFGASIPIIFDGGIVAIGFSLFVVVIASLSLLLDFDNVEQACHAGVGSEYEWVFGVGILSTLVWMYIEFVRLLGFLQD